jgi:hypothetical protein
VAANPWQYGSAVASEPLRVWPTSEPGVDVTDRLERLGLSPILRARRDDRMDEAALAGRYGSLRTHYRLTGPDEAEVALLPRLLEQGDPGELEVAVAAAESRGLRTLVFASHDLEPIMPSASIILLHPGPTRGAQPHADVLAVPYFFTSRAEANEPRPDGPRPSVAFCGQAAARPAARVGQGAVRAARWAANRRRPRVVPPPVRGHVGLRAAALRQLADHAGVDDRFVIRDRYRAGAPVDAARSGAEAEFDDNLRSATYALCVRGTGNFSARFYEALSFGRVPLFVDTDCVLPLEDLIDWRTRTVWVDAGDLDSIGDLLVVAHPSVLDDLGRGPRALRDLWEGCLTSDGFFARLPVAIRRLL